MVERGCYSEFPTPYSEFPTQRSLATQLNAIADMVSSYVESTFSIPDPFTSEARFLEQYLGQNGDTAVPFPPWICFRGLVQEAIAAIHR
jgi:hypothetical protein